MAAGTATISEQRHTSVKRVEWNWTSGTGAEGGTCTKQTDFPYDGKVVFLTTDPGATAPTDDYDVTITDESGYDVLLGAGANRDTANTENVAESSLGWASGSKLTLNITNAGDAKVGKVILLVR